jgi:hypothetical protein
MNWTRSLAMIGLLGAAALTGCENKDVAQLKKDVAQLKKDVTELQDERQFLRDYLMPGGPMDQYLKRLAEAICQIEVKTPGLNPAKRICKTGPGDITSPPKYPPK